MNLNVNCYRPQGKVLFSEVCVILFTGEGYDVSSCLWSHGPPCGPSRGEWFGPSLLEPDSVCQEFCSQGAVPGQVIDPGRYTPLWAGTPLGQVHPPQQVHPQQVHPLKQVHPLGRYTPLGRYPPQQCMLGDMGNKRVVRILLECILVLSVLGTEAVHTRRLGPLHLRTRRLIIIIALPLPV